LTQLYIVTENTQIITLLSIKIRLVIVVYEYPYKCTSNRTQYFRGKEVLLGFINWIFCLKLLIQHSFSQLAMSILCLYIFTSINRWISQCSLPFCGGNDKGGNIYIFKSTFDYIYHFFNSIICVRNKLL